MPVIQWLTGRSRLAATFVGAVLSIFRAARARVSTVKSASRLEILYRDEHLVAVDKPSGMPVHRGWAHDGVPALQLLRDQLGCHVYPVHRLDRSTSGALLFALSSEAAHGVQIQL